MKLTISKGVFNKFPELKLGIVIARDINNTSKQTRLNHLLKGVENFIKLDFTKETITTHPLISPWKAAYGEFNKKPRSVHSSVESLIQQILKKKKIQKTKAADIANYLSLKHLVPIGVHDLDTIQGNISLITARGTERFNKEHPEKGEIIYKDAKEALSRRWNWKKANKTKLSPKTKNVIYYIDALPPVTKTKIKEILRDLIEIISMFSNTKKIKCYALDINNPEISF